MNGKLKTIAYRLAFTGLFMSALGPSPRAQSLFDRLSEPPPSSYEEPRYYEAPRPRPKHVQPKPPVTATPALPGTNPAAPGTPTANAQPGATPEDLNPPPYEPQLLRLSELLGALTYLQDLCSGQEGQVWRTKMSALMDAETQSQVRRERLAGAYNRGFHGYELSYRQCTPNAQAIITRFLDESHKIARDVTRRYGTS